MSKAIVRGQGGVLIASVASLIAHKSMNHDYPLDADMHSQVPLYAPPPCVDDEDVAAVSDLSSQDDEDPSDL